MVVCSAMVVQLRWSRKLVFAHIADKVSLDGRLASSVEALVGAFHVPVRGRLADIRHSDVASIALVAVSWIMRGRVT